MGRHVKNVQLPGETATIPAVSTANRPAGKNGQIIFNSTTATFQAYIGASWHNVSTAAGEKTLVIDKFQGDGSTSVFGGGSGIDIDGSTVASFSTSFDEATDVLVFVGGIAQIPGTKWRELLRREGRLVSNAPSLRPVALGLLLLARALPGKRN